MVKKGEVSSVDMIARTARVMIRDMDSVVTADIPYAQHVSLNVNDFVAVAVFSDNLLDALIIAVF